MNNKKASPSTKRSPRFLLLMPDELRYEIEKVATAHGRTLTREINLRLQQSITPGYHDPGSLRPISGRGLPPSYTADNAPTTATTNDKGPAAVLTDIDRAMLAVFHRLPPEKQLALLSLFR